MENREQKDEKRFIRTFFRWGEGYRAVGNVIMPKASEPGPNTPAFRRPPKADPACFVYESGWDGPDLDPVNLPKSSSGQTVFWPPEGETLHGVFRDTLPGSWGTKQLVEEFPQYAQMSDAERMFWLGSRTWNAFRFLCYKNLGEESPIRGIDVLRKIEARSIRYIKGLHPKGEPVYYDEATRWAVVSGGGARPKAMFRYRGKNMIAKFNVPYDPYNMAKVEHAALVLARRAGLNVARSYILKGGDGQQDVILVERFDYDQDMRMHKLSLATLTGYDNTSYGNVFYADFLDIVKIMRKIDESGAYANLEKDLVELYGRMVFYAYFNVTDCHLRNFEMLLDKHGRWHLAPVFDIQPDPWNTPFATHMVGCGHRNETLSIRFLKESAQAFGIPERIALKVSARIIATLACAPEFLAKNRLVDEEDLNVLENLLDGTPYKEILRDIERELGEDLDSILADASRTDARLNWRGFVQPRETSESEEAESIKCSS